MGSRGKRLIHWTSLELLTKWRRNTWKILKKKLLKAVSSRMESWMVKDVIKTES